MKTRTRTRVDDLHESSYDDLASGMDLESLSDEELESLLFEEEEKKSQNGFWNLPTVAGLSMIVVGMVYLLQEMGLGPGLPSLGNIVAILPWLAGILIILLGFGVLSWRPKKKARKTVRKAIEVPSGKQKIVVEAAKTPAGKKRLVRSRNKKVAGVAAGVAEYFNLDPTLVRIAFVIATLATNGAFIAAYVILAMVMPKVEPLTQEERITIIRDS